MRCIGSGAPCSGVGAAGGRGALEVVVACAFAWHGYAWKCVCYAVRTDGYKMCVWDGVGERYRPSSLSSAYVLFWLCALVVFVRC
jgi:hypothetical protein